MVYRDVLEGKFYETHRAEQLRLIREAYKFYVKNDVRDALAFGAVALIDRYLRVAKLPKEEDAMFVAALYLISRHPFSFANHTSKQEFAEQFGIKASSLEWYSENLAEKLGFIRIYDFVIDDPKKMNKQLLRGLLNIALRNQPVIWELVTTQKEIEKIQENFKNLLEAKFNLLKSEIENLSPKLDKILDNDYKKQKEFEKKAQKFFNKIFNKKHKKFLVIICLLIAFVYFLWRKFF